VGRVKEIKDSRLHKDNAMKLSRKSEYACLALIDLAENVDKGNVRTRDISARRKIPRKYLEQILLLLRRAGYVRSVRGAEGGYRLAKDPGKVTLAEIVRLMDGALAPVESASKYFYGRTPIEGQKKLLRVFKDIRDYVAKKLERTTLSDIT
jgi:Rrf2 family cysteine metabolism transcriptional repressor